MESPHSPRGGTEQNSILFGRFGLRAGWSLLLFFFGIALVGSALVFAFVHIPDSFGANSHRSQIQQQDARSSRGSKFGEAASQPVRAEKQLPFEAAQTVALLLVTLGLAWLERRPFGVFGLEGLRFSNVLGGAGTGLLALSLLVAMLRSLHLLVFDGRLLHGAAALRSGLLWLLVFFVVGLFEECLFRGYIQYTLTRGLFGLGERLFPKAPKRAAFWLAAVAWSALFLVTHAGNPGERSSGLVAVFMAGLLFSYALWRTGSLWWGIGFHASWDWGESFLYGVPDSGMLSAGRLFSTHPAGNPLLSGASAGPEGSLLVIPTMLLVMVALHTWPRTPPLLDFAQDNAFAKPDGFSSETGSGEGIA